MKFVLRYSVARNFCGTFILRIAEIKLAPQMFGVLIVSIRRKVGFLERLIFVIYQEVVRSKK